MGLLDTVLGRMTGGKERKARITLDAVEKLIGDDAGSARDEPRDQDPRYLEAARILRAALSRLTEVELKHALLGGALWRELGAVLARMWPAFGDEAVHAHEQALATMPNYPGFLYGFALTHKYAGRFTAGVELNRRALRCVGGRDESTLWNLGICATGAGDQDAALEAWTGLGIEVKRGEHEVVFAGIGGNAQVRLSERGPSTAPGDGDAESFEYLWIERLGPAHGRILSPTAGNFFADVGDVVLHDGAAAGYRDDGARKVPRFPVMALLRRGSLRTYRFIATQPEHGAVASLEEALGPDSVYVHTEQVEWFCRSCAQSGKVPHEHERRRTDSRIVYGKLVVEETQLEDFSEKLDVTLANRPELTLYSPGLHRALGDHERAGAEELSWNALEAG
jgi:hypothetical protein